MKERLLNLIKASGVSFCNYPVARENELAQEQLAEYLAEHIEEIFNGE